MRWVYIIGLFCVCIPFIGMRVMQFRTMGDQHERNQQMLEDWRHRNHFRGAEDVDLLNQVPPRITDSESERP